MQIGNHQILNESAINLVAKNYSPLHYYMKLISLLESIYPNCNFEKHSKFELHKILNETLLQNYKGEEILKYKLFQHYFKKSNVIGAFEINVNNSRLDFLSINGFTTSYEIKSELDNLSKSKKQMNDYLKAFEYNYIVVDERHLDKVYNLLPEQFGLWSFEKGGYKKIKKAQLSTHIDSEIQLKLLNKKERIMFFPKTLGIIIEILNQYDFNSINLKFKQALKERYKKRWDFLVVNESDILPLDLQFFFNTNIKPANIYSN